MPGVTSRYELRAPAVICDAMDGEVIAIDLEVGRYYRLTGLGGLVWGWLTAGIAPEEIVTGCTDASAASAIEGFVDRLVELNLLRRALGGPDAGATVTSWDLGPLDVEVYSDLEDILGLDPIHEVDPVEGWSFSVPE